MVLIINLVLIIHCCLSRLVGALNTWTPLTVEWEEERWLFLWRA